MSETTRPTLVLREEVLFSIFYLLLLAAGELLLADDGLDPGDVLLNLRNADGVVQLIGGVLEPELDFVRLLFEEVSAFGTVGLSTGITPDLSVASKLVLIFTMYIGRLGAFTLFSLWIDRPDPSIRYTEEMITIG